MNSIVLARYSEELDWIVDVPADWEVIIYNKGEDISAPEILKRADKIIARPNVGRESETYLNHMLTTKGHARDYTVYAQGDPFTHSPDFLALLNCWREWEDIQALSWEWRADKNVPPRHLIAQAEAELMGRLRVRPELFSLSHWGPLEFQDVGSMNMGTVYKFLQSLPDGANIASHLLRRCGLHNIADNAENHMAGVFSYGAIFAVRNYRVDNTPRECLDWLKNFSTEPVAAHGYILERMWMHLFGAEFLRRKAPPLSLDVADQGFLKAV